MSLREETARYEKLTGESAEHIPIIKIGAYLDGVDKGIEELEKLKAEINEEDEKGIYFECKEWIEGRPCDEDYFYGLKRAIMIIDKHISELKGEQE